MSKTKKHTSGENFQRYLRNQMTDAERNAFEREMQKNAFEAEALEGMQQFSAGEIQQDLNKLSGEIAKKKKRDTPIWAVAATIVLLISMGIIWFQLKNDSPVPEIAEIKNPKEQQEKIISENKQQETVPTQQQLGQEEVPPEILKKDKIQSSDAKQELPPIEDEFSVEFEDNNSKTAKQKSAGTTKYKILADKENPQTTTRISEAKSSKETTPKIASKQSNVIDSTGLNTPQIKKIKFTAARNKNSIRGRIISLSDSLPLPGVTIVEKGTSNGTVSDRNGNFTLRKATENDSEFVASFVGMEKTEFSTTGDSIITVGLKPSQLALDEVVTIGYGVSSQQQEGESIQNAHPEAGMSNYKDYLKNSAILPEDFALKREVVRVKLYINPNGEIVKIKNLNDADSILFEKTKQLIFEGPKWKAKTINGVPVESESIVKIVFKKQEENE